MAEIKVVHIPGLFIKHLEQIRAMLNILVHHINTSHCRGYIQLCWQSSVTMFIQQKHLTVN